MLKYSLILTIVNLFHIPTKTDGQTRHSSTYSPDPPQALKLSRKGVEVPCVQVQQSAHLEQCSKVANERCFEESTAGVAVLCHSGRQGQSPTDRLGRIPD